MNIVITRTGNQGGQWTSLGIDHREPIISGGTIKNKKVDINACMFFVHVL